MSKQIAILLDNSGSMFAPVGGANPNTKIVQTSLGAQFFIQNLIDRMNTVPGSQFAISIHRFASTYQILPGCNQIDPGSVGNFVNALTDFKNVRIPVIENQVNSEAAVGFLTDLYDAVRRTADYLIATPTTFGAPGSRVIFLFTDGIQTIPHNGALTRASYEAEQGVTFQNVLNARSIRLLAWGVGSNALGAVLDDLRDQAFPGTTNPVSASKVLFPFTPAGTYPDCITVIQNNAFAVVDNNGVLPLTPVGRPSSGLLWEQFSLPAPAPVLFGAGGAMVAVAHFFAPKFVNHADFEVEVDGSTQELILGLVWSVASASPSLQATSPSGATFSPGSAGTRRVDSSNAMALKIPNPEEGKWSVRVFGDPRQTPLVLDLMARGTTPEFSLAVHAEPYQIFQPGRVKVIAEPRFKGKIAKGRLSATATVLGGDTTNLQRQANGTFTGQVKINNPGITPIRVQVQGTLENKKSIRRIEFATVQLGPATDPRFTLNPSVYEQGRSYSVDVVLQDAMFSGSTRIDFGSGIQVTRLDVLSQFMATAHIRVAPDAFIGAREVVTFNPEAESTGGVRVVEGKGDRGIPGRICCLRFDASGKLVAVVLCDGTDICVTLHDERIQRLLELARDQNLTVKIYVDARGCLTGVDICR